MAPAKDGAGSKPPGRPKDVHIIKKPAPVKDPESSAALLKATLDRTPDNPPPPQEPKTDEKPKAKPAGAASGDPEKDKKASMTPTQVLKR